MRFVCVWMDQFWSGKTVGTAQYQDQGFKIISLIISIRPWSNLEVNKIHSNSENCKKTKNWQLRNLKMPGKSPWAPCKSNTENPSTFRKSSQTNPQLTIIERVSYRPRKNESSQFFFGEATHAVLVKPEIPWSQIYLARTWLMSKVDSMSESRR